MHEDIIPKIEDLIKGLEVRSGSTGMKIESSSKVYISGSTFEGFDTAIDVKNSDDIKIINTQIKSSEDKSKLIDLLKELNQSLKTEPRNKQKITRTTYKLQQLFGYLSPVIEIVSLASKFVSGN